MSDKEVTSIPNGIYYEMPDAKYRAAEGVSQSSLKPLQRSAAHFDEARRNPPEPTAAMLFGRIAHHLTLTPDVAPTWVVEPDDAPRRPTKAQIASEKKTPAAVKSIEFWKAFDAANAGKDVVNAELISTAQACANAVRRHPIAQRVLREGKFEVSLFREYNFGGSLMRKGRIDATVRGPAIFDFKFVEDARLGGYSGNADMNSVKLLADLRVRAFGQQVFDLSYHIQAAYYMDLWNENNTDPDDLKTTFVFFAVEKEPPYAVSTFQLSPDAIGRGRAEYVELLTRYLDCQSRGVWPVYHERSSYCEEVRTLDLPNWCKPKPIL